MTPSAPGAWFIVPAKPFSEAKSRLAPLLTAGERVALAEKLLANTLAVLAEALPGAHRVVVSRDETALLLAISLGAQAIAEDQGGDLNSALAQAVRFAIDNEASDLLIVASDLPLLTPADIGLLIDDAEHSPIVIAPDRHGSGTNALYMKTSHAIEPGFGLGSLERHRQRARALGVEPSLVRSQGLGFDLDLPDDYQQLRLIAPGAWGTAIQLDATGGKARAKSRVS